MQGLSPWVGISFSVSDTASTPLLCLRLCCNGPQVHPWHLVFQIPGRRKGLSTAAWEGCAKPVALLLLSRRPTSLGGTDVHYYWRPSLSVSLWVKALFHSGFDCVVFSWETPIPRCIGQKYLNLSVPHGWHCNELFSPLWSWTPPLALVTCAWCSTRHYYS